MQHRGTACDITDGPRRQKALPLKGFCFSAVGKYKALTKAKIILFINVLRVTNRAHFPFASIYIPTYLSVCIIAPLLF